MMCLRKLALVALISPLLYASAYASARDEVLDAMARCATIADGQARLACYDKIAPRLRDALATPPTALDHEPTKAEQQSWFGFDIGDLFGGGSSAPTTPEQFGKERTAEHQAIREREEIESISAGVTDVSFTPFGKFIVFLDNGQVWRQLEGDSEHAYFHSNVKENKVTISHGAIGSYNLQLNDSVKFYKVTRVK